MTAAGVILLIIGGFVFLVIEAFLVPGFSIPGIVGILMIGYGIIKAKMIFGTSWALIAFAASALFSVILVNVALKSRFAKKVSLGYTQKGVVAVDDYRDLIGKEGFATSPLRPAGTVSIEGKRFDVVTSGEFIEKDSPIIVDSVEGTRIVVKFNRKG